MCCSVGVEKQHNFSRSCGMVKTSYVIAYISPTFKKLHIWSFNYQTKGIVSHRKIVFESKTVAFFWFEKQKYGKKSRLSITLATDYWLLQKEKKRQSIKYTTKKKKRKMACRRVWVILLAHSFTYKVFKLLRFANTSSGMTDILLLDISLFKRSNIQ